MNAGGMLRLIHVQSLGRHRVLEHGMLLFAMPHAAKVSIPLQMKPPRAIVILVKRKQPQRPAFMPVIFYAS
jgi:hypothetical protein